MISGMPTVRSVLAELKQASDPQTKKTLVRHGTPPDKLYGVKVGNMKPIAKKIKGEQQLALDLFDTGNRDAMYLAGLIVDGSKMSRAQLDAWVRQARGYAGIPENIVVWVAAEHPEAFAIANKWMRSTNATTAAVGWALYAGSLALHADEALDFDEIRVHMDHAVANVHTAPNRVRYQMNNFIICVGCYVTPLLKQAKSAAKKIGAVSIDMGDTACQTPLATDYIARVENMGRVGRKRKTLKC
jgi:3-methyladenine DNA glycosylase AlkD